ncbi:MAG: SDR family NAD(P)-dependent oxidoreductase [Anaerolineae bacterium]|nr:SDR family NAD(P)-dependent oxidoreductase [Anaerolineae bacterium]
MKLPDELIFITNAREPQKTTGARLDGRVCVITGATSGVGYEAAKQLAQGGAALVMVCRNPEKAARVSREFAETYGTSTDVVLADFSKLEEVRKAAGIILDRADRIDILINNVGVHRTHRTLTEDGIETVFCVNHLAPFLLTRLLLDRLKASAPARIIQVNSQGHRFGGLSLNDINWKRRPYHGLWSYGASKVAQLHTVLELARRLAGSGVTINAIHPGAVQTNIGLDNGPLYRWYRRNIINRFLKDPHIGGEALYYLAAAPEMAGISGRYFNLTIEEPPASYVMNPELTQRVWLISERLTGLAGSA